MFVNISRNSSQIELNIWDIEISWIVELPDNDDCKIYILYQEISG